MKKKIFFCVFVIASMQAYGQTFQWAISEGTTGDEFSYAITVDDSGNVYSVGAFAGTLDFDPGPGVFNLTNFGSGADVYIQKLDSAGNFRWAGQMGRTTSSGQDIPNAITVDHQGNIYTVGQFRSAFGGEDFDPGPGNNCVLGNYNNYNDIFISKANAAGNCVWAKMIGGGGGDDRAFGIKVDAAGNVYVTGDFENSVDFNPGPVSNLLTANNLDAFIVKLDSSGNYVWAKKMGGAGNDRGQSIALDNFANIYVTGCFAQTADFDPGTGTYNLVSAGDSDIFVCRFDSSGNFAWAKGFGATAKDEGRSIAVDGAGNVYTTGYFALTVDFDPGASISNLVGAGGPDIFIQKLDASGNFVWAKRMGGLYTEHGNSIAVDATGNIFSTGSYSSTTDFDPGPGTDTLSANGYYNMYIQKFYASGNFAWVIDIGRPATQDYGVGLALNNSGAIYLAGNFADTVDFDPGPGTANLISNGYHDFVVAKYNDYNVGIAELTAEHSIVLFPNPSAGDFQIVLPRREEKIITEVFSVLGEKISVSVFSNTARAELHLGNAAPGIYLVKITAGPKQFCKRVSVVR